MQPMRSSVLAVAVAMGAVLGSATFGDPTPQEYGRTHAEMSPSAGPLIRMANEAARARAAARPRVADSLWRVQARVAAALDHGAGGDDLVALSDSRSRVAADGRIQVAIRLTAATESHVAALTRAGVRVERTDLPYGRTAQTWLTPAEIDKVAGLPMVSRVALPDYRRSRAGAVVTQGDGAHRADQVRVAPLCFDGSCVKVGVIANGIDSADDASSSGDLPDDGAGFPHLDIDPDLPGEGDEGTAMLEIIHDLAPAAELAFSGPETAVDMVASIQYLTAAGCHVICDDLGFYGQPYFSDGPVALAAKAAIDAGIVYVSAAGNDRKEHYQGDFNRLGLGGTWFHDFGGEDVAVNISVPPNGSLDASLQWDEVFGSAATDFNLFLLNFEGDMVLASGNEVQDGDDDPYEFLSWTNNTGFDVTVKLSVVDVFGNAPFHVLELFAYGAPGDTTFWQEHVVAADSVFGHPAVTEVLSTAAVLSFGVPCELSEFSSRGPSTIMAGVPVPEVRDTPALAATTCVSITGAGCFACDDPCPPQVDCIFCGTSAAAPHVAGIVAQMLEAKPDATPAEIRAALAIGATDCGDPGFDFSFGMGFADAPESIEALAPAMVLCRCDLNGDGEVDGADLAMMLSGWGLAECNPGARSLRVDLTCDGGVDGDDLAVLLSAWGPCVR